MALHAHANSSHALVKEKSVQLGEFEALFTRTNDVDVRDDLGFSDHLVHVL